MTVGEDDYDPVLDVELAASEDPGAWTDPDYPLREQHEPSPRAEKYERGGLWDLDEATFNLHRREAVCPACRLVYWLPTGAAAHHGH